MRAFFSQTATSTCRTSLPASWNINALRPHQGKSTAELLNALAVFSLSAVRPLVNSAPVLLDFAKKAKVSGPIFFAIKHTFFRTFCAGENLREVTLTMKKLADQGVGGILDYAVEAEVSEGEVPEDLAVAHAQKMAQDFREAIEIGSSQPRSFIAVKITGFLPPNVLLRWTNTLDVLRAAFKKQDTNGDFKVSESECIALLRDAFSIDTETALTFFKKYSQAGMVDWISISDAFNGFNSKYRKFMIIPNEPGAPVEKQFLTEQDFSVIDKTYAALHELCSYGKQKEVRIQVDAEQTYFQPAIDSIALQLCKNLNSFNNKLGPTIFQTYQLYLKRSYDNIVNDIARAERNGYALGVKIVRGAYITRERERAKELGIEDPIHPDINATHRAFNSAIDTLVKKVAEYKKSVDYIPISLIVASHNQGSVAKTVETMDKYNLSAKDTTIGFAQLLGMQDTTTFALARNGYTVYKYLPYGPVDVTIPYLLRRAQENSSLLGGSSDFCELTNELGKRIGLK